MKRVFRIWKFAEYCTKINQHLEMIDALQTCNWPYELEGKTVEEIKNTYYVVSLQWLVEEEESE